MRGGDDDTVPVDLIEVDSPDALLPDGDAPAEPVGGPVHDAAPGRRRRRRTQIGVSAAVVLALAGAGVAMSVLDERRAQARWDALAARGLPLVELGSPLEEAWRLDFGGYPMSASGDVVVLQGWDPTTMSSPWRAIDLSTGEVVWERSDLGDGWCTQWNPAWSEVGSADVGTMRSVLGVTGESPAPPTLLVCTDAGFGGEVPAPGVTATVRVVEIGTGRDVGSVVVEGAVLTFDPAADDVVVSSVVADGTIDLARVALDGGAVRWEVDTEVAAVDADGMYVGPYPQIVDGNLYLVSQTGGLLEVRSVETGETVADAPGPPALTAARMVLPDGSTVEAFYPGMLYVGGSEASDEPTVTVTGPDGDERFTAEGELWSPLFTDGSVPDRIIVSRWGQGASSLVALDLETGEELWRSRAPWSSTMLQVDGVVVTGSGYLSAIDLRTGEEIWEHQTGADIGVAPVTDGSRILVPAFEGGAMSLAALDIRTGTEAWRVPTFSSIQLLIPVDGGVLVGTESALVMYR